MKKIYIYIYILQGETPVFGSFLFRSGSNHWRVLHDSFPPVFKKFGDIIRNRGHHSVARWSTDPVQLGHNSPQCLYWTGQYKSGLVFELVSVLVAPVLVWVVPPQRWIPDSQLNRGISY